MTGATTTRAALLMLAMLPACGGLARHVTITPEDRVVVELHQAAGGELVGVGALRQTLCSESMFDRVEFYSSRESDPLTKILPTDRMQVLLDAFATGGFFEHATERELTTGATSLRTTINGESLVWARVPGMKLSDHEAFTSCWASFVEIYNATPAYRTSTGGSSVLQQHRLQRERRGAER